MYLETVKKKKNKTKQNKTKQTNKQNKQKNNTSDARKKIPVYGMKIDKLDGKVFI